MRLFAHASTRRWSKIETRDLPNRDKSPLSIPGRTNSREMSRHINFLQNQGYLRDDVESLELDDLPGVQGLKALRVGVNIESAALAEAATRG